MPVTKPVRRETASELTRAAEALEEELRRFDAAVEEAQSVPLNTRKNLERSARSLTDIAGIDERLGHHVQALALAVAQARDRRQALADRVNLRAKEIQRRTEILSGLLHKYGELGQHAADLNGLMQQVAQHRQEATTAEQKDEVHQTLEQLSERLGQVAASAEALATEAAQQDYDDLGRQADGLRQQLLSAKNTLSLVLRTPDWKN